MKNFLKKNKKILLISFLVAIILSGAFFETTQALETDWPEAPGGKTLTTTSNLVDFTEYVYRWAILLGGLAAFFALIFGGFKYLTSVGDPIKMKEGQDRIRDALIGLVLLLSSFIILNTLNPELTTITLPTTTVPFLNTSLWSAPNYEKPCVWVRLYHFANYQEDLLNPSLDFFAPGDIDPSDPCKDFGVSVWGLFGWGALTPPKSIQIEGACQLNLYKDPGCAGEFTAISKSQSTLGWMSLDHVHSVRITDFSPPGTPLVKNVTPTAGAPQQNTDQTCNVVFNGEVTDMKRNDKVDVFFEYGKDPIYLDQQLPRPPAPREQKFIDNANPVPFSIATSSLATSSLYYYRAAAFGGALGFASPLATFTLDLNCNLIPGPIF
ncbi:MAG: pilin [Candidatus Nealsonbacteria bacterium]|nr:pilin [Candidatus Nealsonbacteria bacterium]